MEHRRFADYDSGVCYYEIMKGDEIMASVVSAIQNTVPITQFNRGLAGQIFESVKSSGTKVVMKNNMAECVLVVPDEYVAIMDELEDSRLLAIANARLAAFDSERTITSDDFWRDFNITQEDLDSVGEVALE